MSSVKEEGRMKMEDRGDGFLPPLEEQGVCGPGVTEMCNASKRFSLTALNDPRGL